MKKVNPQRIGERGISILRLLLDNNGLLLNTTNPSYDIGIDGNVELTDPVTGENTGLWFGIQCKTHRILSIKRNGTFFQIVKTRHIKYWLDSNLPIILFVVDLNTEVVYWKHINQSLSSMTNKKTVHIIYNTATDILNQESINKIKGLITSSSINHASVNDLVARLKSLNDEQFPNANITTIIDNESIIYNAQPKDRNIPLAFNCSVRIPNNHTDGKTMLDKVNTWLEKGGSLELPKKYISEFMFDGLKSKIHTGSTEGLESIIIKPVADDSYSIRIDLIVEDMDGIKTTVLKSEKLYRLTGGSKEVTFSTSPTNSSVVIEFKQNLNDYRKTLKLALKYEGLTPKEVLTGIEFIQKIQSSKKMTVVDVNRDVILVDGLTKFEDDKSTDLPIKTLAEQLLYIQIKHNIVFRLPKRQPTIEERKIVNDTYFIYKDGIVFDNIKNRQFKFDKKTIQSMIKDSENNKTSNIYFFDQKDYVTIFGQKINRGNYELLAEHVYIDENEIKRLIPLLKKTETNDLIDINLTSKQGKKLTRYYFQHMDQKQKSIIIEDLNKYGLKIQD